jgi:hypothetical protein
MAMMSLSVEFVRHERLLLAWLLGDDPVRPVLILSDLAFA